VPSSIDRTRMPTIVADRIRPALLAVSLVVPLALVPTIARGLDVSVELSDGDALVSQAECIDRSSEEVDVTWDLGGASGTTVEILGSNASGCSESDATTEVLVDGLETSRTSYPGSGESAFTVADVLQASGESVGSCDVADFRIYVCVRLLDSSGSTVATGSAALRFQLERPPPPVSLVVTAGDSALHVSWEAGSATTDAPASSKAYRVFAAAGGDTIDSSKTDSTSLRLGGLQNGTTYDVWIVAYSEAGNASDASEKSTGTPAPVDDFYEVYRKAGGSSQGGCQSTGAGELASALLVMVGLLMCRRRCQLKRPWRMLAAGGLLALATPSPVRGQEGTHGSVELGVGTYHPAIDSDFHGSIRPYAQVFGDRARPVFRLAASWAVWGGAAGRVELGARVGYFRASGHGRFADGTASNDTTSLTVVPTSAILTGRLHLARVQVPLEPYVRLGLERYNWWVTDGSGKTSKRGATNGWSAAVGLAFSLGAFDPESARNLSQETGLKDLSIYADASWARVDDFGSGKAWNLSDASVSFAGGLLVAF
jgi:hypothetical protein